MDKPDIPNKLDDLDDCITFDQIQSIYHDVDIDHIVDEWHELVESTKTDKVDIVSCWSTICFEHLPIRTIRTFANDPDMFHMWYEITNVDNPDMLVESIKSFNLDNPDMLDKWIMLVQMPIAYQT